MQISKVTDIYTQVLNTNEEQFYKHFSASLHDYFSRNLGFRKKKFCKHVLRVDYKTEEQMLNDTALLYGKISADLIRYLLYV